MQHFCCQFYIFVLFVSLFDAGKSMPLWLGGIWVTCPVGQGTPLMTVGGVTRTGRRTGKG